MNGSPLDPSESAIPPLGPAISPRVPPRPSSLGEMVEPLAPFGASVSPPPPPAPAVGWPGPGALAEPLPPLAPELDAIDSGSGAVDDLPWLSLDEPVGEPAAFATHQPEPEPELEPLSDWELGWVRESAEVDLEAEAPVEGLEGLDGWRQEEPEPEPESAPWREPPAEPTPQAEPAAAAARAVAERLEEIARTLREHGPAALLAGHTRDPLDLLVAGYALGQAAAAEERGGTKPS